MIITKTCKDCGYDFEIREGESEHYQGIFFRPKTKEQIWLCKNCRPEFPETIELNPDGSVGNGFISSICHRYRGAIRRMKKCAE